MVGKDEVKSAIGDAGICTINALLPAQHAGTGGNSYGRPGRIAGSVNLPAAHLLDPATNAFLPADTASLIAEAIMIGSFAAAMAVFSRTPSKPSSIALAASLAVPNPASMINGTSVISSRIIRSEVSLARPIPVPMGAPSGMTAAAPASISRFAKTISSDV